MRRLVCLLLVLACLGAPRLASAAVPLCVRVKDSTRTDTGLEQLVKSELRKHTSHTLVEVNCSSRLIVELFNTGNVKYLSLGLEGEVPSRYAIANDSDLEPHLVDGITLALKSDPEFLIPSTGEASGIERLRQSTLVHGKNTYRLEVFETVARTDTQAAFASGIGFGVHRGAEHWQIFARAYFSASPSAVAQTARVLRIGSGLDLGIAYEFSRRAFTTPYVGAGVGVGLLRFEGLTDPTYEASADHVEKLGAMSSLRLGLRTMRLFDFDADVFLAGYLPLFKTSRVDATLFGDTGVYTPFVQLGVGVGF